MSINTSTNHASQSRLYTKASTRRLRLLFASWLRQKSATNKIAILLAVLALCAGYLTYAALNNIFPFENSSSAIIWMLNIDLIIILSFLILIIRRISLIWASRKEGAAGAKLHVKLIYIFTLIAGLPAIVMTLFSAFFFLYSIHGWFSDKVANAINESQAVAQAYLQEHQETIKADILAMATDLNRQSELLNESDQAMQQMLQTQSFFRNFSEVALLNSEGRVLFQTGLTMSNMAPNLTPDMFKSASSNIDEERNIYILNQDEAEDRLRALVNLKNYDNTYLFVSRLVDPKVLDHLEATRAGVLEYEALRGSSTKIQITITSIYLVIALLLVSSAIWFALNLARGMVQPISALISATERVRDGDLSARAKTGATNDEFETLGNAFNAMTEQLQIQQNELIDANKMLDYRRRFTETILGGVSTGVISIDHKFNITLINQSGLSLLSLPRENLIGRHIAAALPESFPYVEQALAENEDLLTQEIIEFRRSDGAKRFLRISISVELVGEEEMGAILTFDDITDIQIAQRRSAWSDVARRIAHEIKNPLTPIQLSTERLKRRYLKQIEDEKDKLVFSQCTETIIKHVDDIKNMVNAFSDFAKMPDPVFTTVNISKLIKEIYALQSEAAPDVDFAIYDPQHILDSDKDVSCDEQQIRQSITNLIKNGIEAQEDSENDAKLGLFLEMDHRHLYIGIADNGSGIPMDLMNHITEPYVTNKKKGTGLGLAIVKKIIEDHGGDIHFSNEPQHHVFDVEGDVKYNGAYICIYLPVQKAN